MLLSSRLYRKFGVLVVGTLVISALAAGPALAGKRVKVQRTGLEQCAVIPNPVSNDVVGTYSVVGSGFTPGQFLTIVTSGGGTMWAPVDSVGNFSNWSWAQFLADGTNDVYVGYAGDRHGTVQAHCSVLVL